MEYVINSENNIKWLTYPILEQFKEIKHFTSLKPGGFSYIHNTNTLNMGFTDNDLKDNVIKNRELLCKTLGIDTQNMIFSNQKHSSNIAFVNSSHKGKGLYNKNDAIDNNDGYIFLEKNICPIVLTADCAAVFIYEYEKKICTLLHCGWRGVLNNILKEALLKIETIGGSKSNIVIAISPAASKCCYEIGEELFMLFNNKFEDIVKEFIETRNNKYYFDLGKCIYYYLINNERINPDKIQNAGLCTICNSHLFFSARASKGITGRMASGLLII
ncbi:MAG: polyphenol oxidase family protein [Bacteroidales bacterium]|nr:polyphenol oxidase family protein [Bacteroidales bacterium]